ncbi:MAG: hypothetical protein IT434_09575 [Phycisphaerales bacterium]|nr:hypothetical protein [Phycisphaerales bacterium]
MTTKEPTDPSDFRAWLVQTIQELNGHLYAIFNDETDPMQHHLTGVESVLFGVLAEYDRRQERTDA